MDVQNTNTYTNWNGESNQTLLYVALWTCRTPIPTPIGTESPTKLCTCSLMDVQNTTIYTNWNGESNRTLYMKPFWTSRTPIPTPTGTESPTKLST
ncbi:hypothetical protein PoB_007266800 [Plakobranchus ocellatus]|uniref:Uncharacterized protein n=1 Tax=Plakobranchus ocellatus TaxID=259542 RepID=A0AAV4DQ29_9GAST|nr:hypothetical protein PoB_007266800 [Plakobranchus ocellatus]